MPSFEVVTPDSRLVKSDYAKLVAESFSRYPQMYDAKYAVTKIDLASALQREQDLYGDDSA